MIEQKMKVEEDKVMAKEEKIKMATRLDERTSEVQKLTKTQLDIDNQLLLTSQELGWREQEGHGDCTSNFTEWSAKE